MKLFRCFFVDYDDFVRKKIYIKSNKNSHIIVLKYMCGIFCKITRKGVCAYAVREKYGRRPP